MGFALFAVGILLFDEVGDALLESVAIRAPLQAVPDGLGRVAAAAEHEGRTLVEERAARADTTASQQLLSIDVDDDVARRLVPGLGIMVPAGCVEAERADHAIDANRHRREVKHARYAIDAKIKNGQLHPEDEPLQAPQRQGNYSINPPPARHTKYSRVRRFLCGTL